MASEKLGAQTLTAATYTTVYTVPSGKVSSININVVNRGAVPARVDVALATSGTPTDADYIEFGATIPANGGILERSALAVSAGERVVVRSTTDDCTVRVHGFEENI
jgi:hypothetical protein